MKHKIEAKVKFEVGSRYFFTECPGYDPKDSDELWILPEPLFGRNTSFLIKNVKKRKDIILYPPFSKEEFISHDLQKNDRMKFGKYIIPEFAEYIGLTIKDLIGLKPLVSRLDEQHMYQRVIYDAYLENGEFFLTDVQRTKAYESYIESRSGEALKRLEARKIEAAAERMKDRLAKAAARRAAGSVSLSKTPQGC
jgi:hypothetical protein